VFLSQGRTRPRSSNWSKHKWWFLKFSCNFKLEFMFWLSFRTFPIMWKTTRNFAQRKKSPILGIVIRRGNVQSPQFLIWQDITNLVNHKRYFGIECQNYEFSVQFILDEPDAAKYVWKMCKFFAWIYCDYSAKGEN